MAKPFVKWVGGKRQIMDEIKNRIPLEFDTYFEPFVGGGAVLFELQPGKAVINDFNTELTMAYKVIRDNVGELIEDLKKHKNTKEYFYEIRQVDRTGEMAKWDEIKIVSRFLYLNKTGYNGMYRVNKSNQYNVPFADYKNPNIVNEEGLTQVSHYLRNNDIKVMNGDFYNAIISAKSGDFVYLDPPYIPVSDTSAFTSYTHNGFDYDDQLRLRDTCIELDKRGVKFLLSNSNTALTQDLYKDFNIDIVMAKRAINSKGNGRGEVQEVLVRNYDYEG